MPILTVPGSGGGSAGPTGPTGATGPAGATGAGGTGAIPWALYVDLNGRSLEKNIWIDGVPDGAVVWGVDVNGVPDGG